MSCVTRWRSADCIDRVQHSTLQLWHRFCSLTRWAGGRWRRSALAGCPTLLQPGFLQWHRWVHCGWLCGPGSDDQMLLALCWDKCCLCGLAVKHPQCLNSCQHVPGSFHSLSYQIRELVSGSTVYLPWDYFLRQAVTFNAVLHNLWPSVPLKLTILWQHINSCICLIVCSSTYRLCICYM